MNRLRNFSILAAISVAMLGVAQAEETISSIYPVTGETLTCISLSQLKSTDALDDSTILFKLRNGEILLNHLRSSCISLERNQRFSFKTTQNKICNGDIITTANSVGMEIGSCGLGDFEFVAAP